MNPRTELDGYLDQVRIRLRRVLYARGAAVTLSVLLVLTLLATFVLGRTGFSPAVVLAARIVGVLVVIACLAGMAWILRRQSRDGGAAILERNLPDQGGRIDTYLQERRREAEGTASPLIDLLAQDAQDIALRTPVAEALPQRRWLVPGAATLGVTVLLGFFIFAGPGLWGDGARRLWLGVKPPAERIAEAAGGIAVQPGNVTVRRNQDLPVTAQVQGGAGAAQLHVRHGKDGAWEAAPMEADGKGGYTFTLFALREAASYYVSAGRLKSREHQVAVVDLPRIESLKLTYNYPSWTGLARRVEDEGGDIRAVEGTRVALEVVTNTPMESPLLVINGREDGMRQSGVKSAGELTVNASGHYRIATLFGNEVVALTEDFVIDLVPDEPPQVQITRPGRDYQATNIEEVPVAIKAQDDFRLQALELRYSVNGGEWRSEKLDAGAADVQAAALLRLEEMQQAGPAGAAPLLVPGDLVSYYAQARDRRNSVETDLFLIQVQPFDRRFTQSQAGGAAGGAGEGGEEEGAISQRQREVLLATWNLQRSAKNNDEREVERRADSARMLAEVQNTLAEQANTLVERAQARQLTGEDANVRSFVESLAEAVKSMKPAAQSLGERNLEQAVAHEQRALQYLLRAESTFRDIQVAMQSNAAGGGGGQQAGRDVSEMTELELDLSKNQYESEPQMTAQQRSESENDMMSKLRDLAKRQEQLAREARNNAAQPEAQRWQQEQLRREAEELRRQLEQLAQQRSNQQQQQSGQQQGNQQQQSGQQQGSQQGGQQQQANQQQGGQQGSSSSASEAAQQVAQALRNMQSGDQESARRAGQQLERAREQLERSRQQALGESFEEMERAARSLLDRQRRTEQELRAAVNNRPPASIANPGVSQNPLGIRQARQLAEEKRDLQSDLEALQRQMRQAQQGGRERTPEASQRLAQESAALDEAGTSAGLSRSAMEIERGRGVQAAMRDELITQSLEQLASGLGEAAGLAAGESGSGPQGDAEPGELLAELGELRRAIEAARSANQVAQNANQPGQGTNEGGTNEGGANGGDARGTGGARGPNDGARGTNDGGRMAGGAGLQPRMREGADRFGELRRQLQPGALSAPDLGALRELTERMRRAGGDPMADEYQRMVSLVNQLELAALRAESASGRPAGGRADVVDDPGRYRENVAEYYRKLGGEK